MPLKDSVLVSLFIGLIVLFTFQGCFSHVYGVLGENGVCTNGKITVANEVQVLNLSIGDYIKKLMSDNRLMAEMLCHSMLNETVAK